MRGQSLDMVKDGVIGCSIIALCVIFLEYTCKTLQHLLTAYINTQYT
jgi:hypothetical protein